MKLRRFMYFALIAAGAACLSLSASASDKAWDAYVSQATRFDDSLGTQETEFRYFIVTYGDSETSQASRLPFDLDFVGRETGTELSVVRRLATGAWLVASAENLDRDRAKSVLRKFAVVEGVQFAEPDHIAMAHANDPKIQVEWHLKPVGPSGDLDTACQCIAGGNVLAAWATGIGTGATIAVLDTGFTDHPDLVPNLAAVNSVTGKVGYDFVSNLTGGDDHNDPAIGDPLGRDANAHDPGTYASGYNSTWHGTIVAGVAAAAYNNALYGAGVAPGAKILPVRVIGARDLARESDIVDAIVWASGGAVSGVPANNTPARVINVSIGVAAPCSGSTFQSAINMAGQRNAVVVVSAGNDNADVSGYRPAGCTGTNLITVAGSDYVGGKSRYSTTGGAGSGSNFGALVAVTAPAGGLVRQREVGDTDVPIQSDWNTGPTTPGQPSFKGFDGTSLAAPQVSGLAAAIIAINPSLSASAVKNLITAHAHAWGTAGLSANPVPGKMGTGVMDATQTLLAVPH